MGKKWNAGYSYVKKFNPDAVLFVGSSDWISSNWIDRAYIEILHGAGYVGKTDFDMFDITNKQGRYCKWDGYLSHRKNETIGIGRLVSRKLLEAINYKPFPELQDAGMDYGMYLQCIKSNMLVKILENDSLFLSISCDLWENKHVFNMHYYGSLMNYKQYYKRDRSGCKNIRGTQCDIHPSKDGCVDEINFFWEYNKLFRNGHVYTSEDEKLLHNEFPELSEFINDYLKIKG